jgi:hypothetical protein
MSATDRKFKVGDRVRVLAGIPWVLYLQKDAILRVADIRQDRVHGQQIKVEGYESDGWYHHSHFVAAPPTPQPIRTVTRREIVPGVYGRVTVKMNVSPARMSIGLTNIAGAPIGDTAMSADELREAAHIFNQIAEVLEENEKEVA